MLLTVAPETEDRQYKWHFFLFSDFPMQLNMALFEFNGRTGYLLKHDVMRRSDKKFDPFCDRIDTVVASTLTIKVGSKLIKYLPYRPINLKICRGSTFQHDNKH